MNTDLALSMMSVTILLWMITSHIQTPVELLFQSRQSTISNNNSTMISSDNNSTCTGLLSDLYQSSLELVPIKCKVTSAITSKEENEIGTINFSQFPTGIIQVSGEINNDDYSNFYLEIEASDDKVANIRINDSELFIKRECGIMYFIFETRSFSINNKCNLNQKRMRKNIIGKNFVVYVKKEDDEKLLI